MIDLYVHEDIEREKFIMYEVVRKHAIWRLRVCVTYVITCELIRFLATMISSITVKQMLQIT